MEKIHDTTLLIKLPKKLKKHAKEYYKTRGGLSEAIRQSLIISTKYKPAQK